MPLPRLVQHAGKREKKKKRLRFRACVQSTTSTRKGLRAPTSTRCVSVRPVLSPVVRDFCDDCVGGNVRDVVVFLVGYPREDLGKKKGIPLALFIDGLRWWVSFFNACPMPC